MRMTVFCIFMIVALMIQDHVKPKQEHITPKQNVDRIMLDFARQVGEQDARNTNGGRDNAGAILDNVNAGAAK